MKLKGISKKQKEILEIVVKYGIPDNFYLAGGTALVIYFQHRYSDDFDFFGEEFDIEKMKVKINNLLKNEKINFKTLDEKEDTYIFLLNEVKVSFFKYLYPIIRPLKAVEGINIASIEDIIAMKAVAIIQRGTRKDFFDIWHLIKEGYTIEKMISFAKEKYGDLFSPMIFLKALIYFEDAEKEQGFEFEWKEIKEFLIKEVKKLL